jgi:hypothetical protein
MGGAFGYVLVTCSETGNPPQTLCHKGLAARRVRWLGVLANNARAMNIGRKNIAYFFLLLKSCCIFAVE